jgi:glycosyltransferase involved in cell wall biosynthesis
LERTYLRRRIAQYDRGREAGGELFTDGRYAGTPDFLRQLPTSDVVHVHWIANFLDYETVLRTLTTAGPVLWTLHDMNPFTGGCHLDLGCGKFRQKCGACPQLASNNADDLSARTWRHRKELYDRISVERLHLAVVSRWMAQQVEQSTLLSRFPVTAVPLGVDVEEFEPRDRSAARNVLGIPANARVLLFAADSIERKIKGFRVLSEALARITSIPGLFLLWLGRGATFEELRLPHRGLGYVSNDRLLSMVYSAADVFVMPSMQEAFGQAALEAMACGTPVVASDVGGIPELVRHNVTGLLVPAGDARALSEGIRFLLDNPEERARMSESGRRVAVSEYSLERQSRQYLAVYEAMLGGA